MFSILPAAADVLAENRARRNSRHHASNRTKPSPFASALLFSYIANYIYEGDAPLAERRAQALSIDQSQLEEILGSTDFRELLDKAAIDEVEAQLQSLDPEYQAKHADGVHDLLLNSAISTEAEIAARSRLAGGRFHRGRSGRRAPRCCAFASPAKSRFIPVEYAAAIAMRSACRCRPGSPKPF